MPSKKLLRWWEDAKKNKPQKDHVKKEEEENRHQVNQNLKKTTYENRLHSETTPHNGRQSRPKPLRNTIPFPKSRQHTQEHPSMETIQPGWFFFRFLW